MIDPAAIPVSNVVWSGARRIIRGLYPPIDLFEDIADPADWPLLIAAEQKTNPRLIESLGALDLIPHDRRVGGPGASFLMAPFTHVSRDRPSRLTRGEYGVLYAARHFETALFETMHHHARFMARTAEPPGWTSQFRELILDVWGDLHDLRGQSPVWQSALKREDHIASQTLAMMLREQGSNGLVYPSLRHDGGECVGLFYPDCAQNVVQGRHLDYHWNGQRVDFYRDVSTRSVFRVLDSDSL